MSDFVDFFSFCSILLIFIFVQICHFFPLFSNFVQFFQFLCCSTLKNVVDFVECWQFVKLFNSVRFVRFVHYLFFQFCPFFNSLAQLIENFNLVLYLFVVIGYFILGKRRQKKAIWCLWRRRHFIRKHPSRHHKWSGEVLSKIAKNCKNSTFLWKSIFFSFFLFI